jgi:hypothetical protein
MYRRYNRRPRKHRINRPDGYAIRSPPGAIFPPAPPLKQAKSERPEQPAKSFPARLATLELDDRNGYDGCAVAAVAEFA